LISLGRQVNPEYLIKFDAASIVVFQIFVSYIIARWNPFNAMVSGVIVASIGIGAAAWLHNGWPVVLAIVVFLRRPGCTTAGRSFWPSWSSPSAR